MTVPYEYAAPDSPAEAPVDYAPRFQTFSGWRFIVLTILMVGSVGYLAIPWTAMQWRRYGQQTGERTYYVLRGLLYPLYWPAMISILAESRRIRSLQVSGLVALLVTYLLVFVIRLPLGVSNDWSHWLAWLDVLPFLEFVMGTLFLLYFQRLVNVTGDSTYE